MEARIPFLQKIHDSESVASVLSPMAGFSVISLLRFVLLETELILEQEKRL